MLRRLAEMPILLGPVLPELSKAETLPDLFEATVRTNPTDTALISDGRTWTYAELDRSADIMSHRLIADGWGGAGQIIALWLPRGAEALIAQLGIGKSGAAWLPCDADTPPERVAQCAHDAQASALITTRELADRMPALHGIPILEPRELLAALPEDAPLRRRHGLTPEHPAYVIYTSGSTGRPKGIVVPHRAICHFLRSENSVLGIARGDRVYQGFSLSFDMSFEEIWIAYLVGASLWVAPKSVHTDPDALAAALTEQAISVLHLVPSQLALLPELPATVRLINLGGEACPQAVADRWAMAPRRVFNTYGPTETTVSATIAELRSGTPVTIGRPLPNYVAVITDTSLTPVPAGTPGELCIAGPGLATGYLGRPDLTRERYPEGPFAELPGITRLYRTGDLAQVGPDGGISFLGRIDDQVKVRGFRVELGEIESAITGHDGVRAAAVMLRDDTVIAAVVVEMAAEARPGLEDIIRQRLTRILPGYMVPSRIVVVAELPRLASGKVDRATLLRGLPAGPGVAGPADVPATPAEVALSGALAELFPGRPFRRSDDFFDDLGGHSLTAARLVSRLRAQPAFAGVSVGTIYVRRRIGAIAESIAQPPPRQRETVARPAGERHRRWLCGFVQALLLPIPVCINMAVWLAPFFTYHYLTGDEGDSIWFAAAVSTLVLLLAQVFTFVAAIVAKWLVLGRLQPGRHPLWGMTYLRWWFARRMVDATPDYLLSGTPLYRVYLRLLGARVGRDVVIGSVEVAAPDLLAIGDDAAIGSAVQVANARVEGGWFIADHVRIGADAQVDSSAVLEGGAVVGDGATLGQLSALSAGVAVPVGEIWEGAPARRIGMAPATSAPFSRPTTLRRIGEWLLYPLVAGLVSALFFLPIFPAFMLIDWIDAQWFDSFGDDLHLVIAFGCYLLLGIPGGAVLVLVTLLCAASIRHLVHPRPAAGTWPVHGPVYYASWLTNQIQENSLHLLHGLFATVYAPLWFRLIGARVGRGAEISTAMGVTPELLTLGDDSFIADGAMLGDSQVRRGRMTLVGTRIGARSFVGNGACVPDGTDMPDDVLVGVQTLAPANAAMASGQTWMGSPALILPAREMQAAHPAHLTFRPALGRRLARGAVELVRIVAPLAYVMAFGYLAVHLIMPMFEDDAWLRGLAALTIAGFAFGLASLVLVVVAKWVLIGRYRPGSAPMWTPFVWLSEAVTAVYESLAVPNFLEFMRGTPLLPFALRCLGTRIGRGVYLDTTDITEFDCVTIGDRAELNANCGPQTHLFEDRVMKIGAVRIGAEASIAACSTILYDAEVGAGVRVGVLTLVAKGERLPPDTSWCGTPAAPA